MPWTYVIEDLSGKKIIWTFYEKELQKANHTELKIKKVIKKKHIFSWITSIWLCNKSRLKRSNKCWYSNLTTKSILASLKADVDKIEINKLETILVDLVKLSNIADNGFIKKLCMIN